MSANLPPTLLPDEALAVTPEEIRPNIDHIKTEDDTPVDNVYSEKQQRLLTVPLYDSWKESNGNRPFVAMANVGLFFGVKKPPIVPDVLLSLDVEFPENIRIKEHRSYFIWEYGKAPEVVIEVVSNLVGNEFGRKKDLCAQVGILYYIVWDPDNLLRQGRLNGFVYDTKKTYSSLKEWWFPDVGLGLTIWHGPFEESEDDWLRWCDQQGNVYLTGQEAKHLEKQRAEQEKQRAEQERQRAEQEKQRAEQERQRAEQEKQRADRLATQLRALGIKPEE